MSLIPDEELQAKSHINLAPMVDFLFLVLAVFATLAVTRAVIYDTEVSLATLNPEKETPAHILHQESYIVTLSVTEEGKYKWITEFNEYLMPTTASIQKQLFRQQELGLLPKEKEHTQVLLHLDKNAKWEQIAQLIFAVREAGFKIHPVYESDKE